MRSVVLKSTPRCARCRLPPRWCVCQVEQAIECPCAIDILMHHREQHRPSSTGKLINRVLPASRHHEWRRERQLQAADVRLPARDLWILHPQGGPVPEGVPLEQVQVVLLDGAWREASAMAHEVRGWGQLVNLPMVGESRYWLRTQNESGRFSTVEALMFLLSRFGLSAARDALAAQMELHVYASLRARGQKELAAQYLCESPIMAAFPDFVRELNVRRPAAEPDRNT